MWYIGSNLGQEEVGKEERMKKSKRRMKERKGEE